MQIIDLSLLIQPHWRWTVNTTLALDHKNQDPFQVTVLSLSVHAFTHIDTPLHIEPDRQTIDQVPLNRLCGPAAVIDLSHKGQDAAITAADLAAHKDLIRDGDIVLLKTGWDRQRDPITREYWTQAPYVDEDAAMWLAERPITAVGFDFPQDYVIRDIPQRHPPASEMPTHHHLLRKGVYLIEYLCNLDQLTTPRATVFALPLKVQGAEGAPARVVAIPEPHA